MKYLPLIWVSLFRHRLRTVLTLVSVLVAFLIFGLLDTVRTTFASFGQSTAGHDRVVTIDKRYRPLPISLLQQIQEMEGVAGVEHIFAFSGTYQNPKNVVPIETHTENYYALYPELEIEPEAREAFHRSRTAALAGEALMKKFGWRIGDKIPLKTSLPRKDGADVWTFDLVGTYSFKEPGMKVWESILYANWDYVNEARAEGEGTVLLYSTKVTDVSQVDRISRDIDALSTNSGHETKTQSDNLFNATLISQFGDLGRIASSVMGAVFFTLLLLTGHAMAQSVRERIPEMGVLKTLGFKGRAIMSLVLSESVLLLVLGSTLGLAMASLTVFGVRSTIGVMLPTDLPIPVMPVGSEVWMRGIALAVFIGLIVGLLPALRGLRLSIVDALANR